MADTIIAIVIFAATCANLAYSIHTKRNVKSAAASVAEALEYAMRTIEGKREKE